MSSGVPNILHQEGMFHKVSYSWLIYECVMDVSLVLTFIYLWWISNLTVKRFKSGFVDIDTVAIHQDLSRESIDSVMSFPYHYSETLAE